MNFKRYSGDSNIHPYKKKASTAFNIGDAVFLDSSGFLDKAAAATTADSIIGVIQETIASTDTDYAVARDVSVDVARKGDNGDWFTAVVGTGTAAQTSVGEEHDLGSDGTVDLNATSILCVKVERFIDAATVIVSFRDGDAT